MSTVDVVEVVAQVEQLAADAPDEETKAKLRAVAAELVSVTAPMLARRVSDRVIELQRAARASLNGGD